MNLAELYIQLGLEHILDLAGLDHVLFLIVLVVPFTLKDWRTILLLVSIFTIGHSISLYLATIGYVQIEDPSIVEMLIPITIIATAFYNLFNIQQGTRSIHTILTLLFGIIHGLGFSNYLKMILIEEHNILLALLNFAVGIEIGQLIVVLFVLLLLYLVCKIPKVTPRILNKVISIIVICWAISMFY